LIYPRAQAQLIANATRQPVPATDSDATRGGAANVFTVEPEATVARNNAAAEQNTPAVEEQAPPSTETQAPPVASRESRPATSRNRSSASAARTQQPVGTSGNEAAATPPTAPARQQTARNGLPGTASPLPIVGLLGLVALAGGIGLRLARRSAAGQ
jgi:cobalamin biosynthesis Mg chelatase CobN